jgi:hypothetical protein
MMASRHSTAMVRASGVGDRGGDRGGRRETRVRVGRMCKIGLVVAARTVMVGRTAHDLPVQSGRLRCAELNH